MAATLTISPSTVTPGATFTASGTAQRKGGASASCRILVENVVKSTFSVGQSGKYSRQIGAPTGADRTVQVLLQQLQGTGQWATTAPARTLTIQGSVPAPQPTIPTVPLSFSGVAGNTTAALSWSAPSSNGGSALTGYIVYKNGALLANIAAGTTTYTAVALVNGTASQFSVAAKNAIGTGPQTSPITVTPVAPGDTTAPVVSNLAHSSVTQTSAVISWTASEPVTGRVRYGLSPTALTLLTTAETSFNYSAHVQNVSGLTANTPYHYQAFGADAAGNPYTSAVQSFTTAAVAVPPPPPPGPVPPDTFSGDATGVTDVTAALNAWIASRPAGAASLSPNGIYRISNQINIARHNLEIVGQGAQTRYLSHANCSQPNWYMTGHDIILRDLTAKGAHPNPGTYHEYCEWSHGFEVVGGYNIELDTCHSLNNRGDGLYVAGRGHHISWHDGSVRFNGRMGIAVVDGDDVTITDMAFERIAYSSLDCEPNPGSGQSVNRVTMTDTTTNGCRSQFFASYGYGPMNDITVERNTVTGAPFGIWSAVGRDSLRMRNVKFNDNHGDTAFYGGDGAVFSATNVDGLIVTNNSNPVTPGQGMVFLKTTGCTGVTNSGNTLA